MIKTRLLWGFVLLVVLVGAWFSGERGLYLAALVLVLLPAVSLLATFFLLRRLQVKREQPATVSKNAAAALVARLHNNTFMPLSHVEIVLNHDENAIKLTGNQGIPLKPFARHKLEIPFKIEYRGQYALGLAAVRLTDITGLFKLSRKYGGTQTIICLPGSGEMPNASLTMNLMTQASSRYDIRDEDYSTVSDIRQYLPTDSIKRVHWKLTAKRNEWLVKNFQSNALNLVSVILDSARLPLHPRECYALEDVMVENALGLAKFCLGRNMPVDFLTTEGRRVTARNPGEFDFIYSAASEMQFTERTALDVHSILSQALNDATGYVNAVIMTTRISARLYERILNGANNGHFIAVLYFEPLESGAADEKETKEIVKLLAEGGMPCFRVDGAIPPSAPEAPEESSDEEKDVA